MGISVVDPDNDTGTDYVSLAAWAAGEVGNQGGAVCRADCRSSGGSSDTGGVVNMNAGHFTNFTGDITIQPLSDTYRHDGTVTGNSLAYHLVVDNTYCLRANVEHTVIDGLIFENTKTVGGNYIVYCSGTTLAGNIFLGASASSGVQLYGALGDCYFVNNLVLDTFAGSNTPSLVYFAVADTNNDYICYNNTCIGGVTADRGIRFSGWGSGSPNIRVFNNIVQDTEAIDYSDVTGITSGGNISSDATSPEASLRNISLTFAGANDYHLDITDTEAIGTGVDLSSDSYYPVTEDIDQGSRADPPCIGADEAVFNLTKTITDAVASFDAISPIAASITISDNAAAADSLGTVTVSLTISDSSAAADSVGSVSISLVVSDAITAADVVAEVLTASERIANITFTLH